MNNSQDPELRHQALKEWALATLFFTALIAIFFYPAVFQGKLIYSGDSFGSDLLDFNIPRRYLVTQAIKDGEFPLWEPLIGAGTTVQAEGHPGIFYPINTPLNLCFSITTAANLTMFLAMYFAFLGCYWLVRTYKLSPASALLAATAFSFGGTFIFRLRHLNIIHAISWIPASLACLRLFIQNGHKKWLFGLGTTWTLQLLAGHPQIVVISHMAYWCYALGLFIIWKISSPKQWLKSLGLMALAGLLALAISAVQWMPTYEMTQLSLRGEGKNQVNLANTSYTLEMLPCLFKPYALCNPAKPDRFRPLMFFDARPYWGILPLCLVLLAFTRSHRREAILLLALTALSFWIALGPKWGMYNVLYHYFPGFRFFRYPCRMILPVGIYVSILSAMGFQNLCDMCSKRRQWAAKVLAVIAIGITSLDLYVVNDKFQEYLPSNWSDPPASLKVIGPHQRLYSPVYMHHWIKTIFHTGWKGQSDLLLALLNELPVDLSAIWGVESPVDQGLLASGLTNQYHTLLHYYILQNIDHHGCDHIRGDKMSPEALSIARLFSISHILSFTPILDERDRYVSKVTYLPAPTYPKATLLIYELKDPLPEARLVPEMIYTMPPQFTKSLHPIQFVDDSSLYEPDYDNIQSIGKCELSAQGRNAITVTTDCDIPSYLILSRTYHPNWKASIDNGPWLPILRVNMAFQGLKLPAGHHEIRLKYSSPAFSLAWKISLGTLILIIAGALYIQIRRKPFMR